MLEVCNLFNIFFFGKIVIDFILFFLLIEDDRVIDF